jgi:predicted O-linked N-acetylglucosamine transferase (SPINDLY family)
VGPVKRIAEVRSRLMTAGLRLEGSKLDHTFRTPAGSSGRLRVGILNVSFLARSETFAMLPLFEHLDRQRFEVVLLAMNHHGTRTEAYCASRADRAILLPDNVAPMVNAIRSLDLDLLVFGNNLSGMVRFEALLGLHRLARVQVNTFCSPMTSGSPKMDAFLVGDLTEPGADAQQDYTERLLRLPGSGICFSFQEDDDAAGQLFDRETLGIAGDAVVFVSGANCHKISPGLRRSWARILARVPDACLLLYPFGPSWGEDYPERQLRASLAEALESEHVAHNRLKILGPLKNGREIRSLLSCADLYLDAFPYSGATSLQDPLQAGLPSIVLEGPALRFRQGAALLREAGLPDLVTLDPVAYEDLAVRLALDQHRRAEIALRVRQSWAAPPPFRNSATFAKGVMAAYVDLAEEWNRHARVGAEPS